MYIFYDLETTDIDRDFGQILQVGLVVTDDDLNIVEEKSLRCRLQPAVVPSPQALLVTGITPQQLTDEDDTIFTMMQEIDQLLRSYDWPITTSGYNSMDFDERGLRSALHQTLMDPSLTFQKQDDDTPRNQRIDVMRLVQACIVHAPDALTLEQKTRHKTPQPAISLGVVARQNGVEFSEEEAHEAVADVKATIAVAQKIRDEAPELWQQMLNMVTEEGVKDFLDENEVVSYATGYAGNMKHYMVAPVAVNDAYERQEILFDLSQDPADYMDKPMSELVELLGKDTGKKVKNNPFYKVLMQKQPIFMPLEQTAKELLPAGVDEETLKTRAALIRDNLEFQAKIAQAAALAEEEIPVPDAIEKQLYIDLPADVETRLSVWRDEFQAGDWETRADLMRGFAARFADDLKDNPTLARFPEFAKRIIFENAPQDTLTAQEQKAFKASIHHKMTDPDAPEKMMTIARAHEMLDKMREELAAGTCKYVQAGEEHKLDELAEFYNRLEQKFAPAPAQAPKPPKPAAPK